MLDERPGIPATQRFKAIGGNARTGLHLWTSADGIHWREQPGTVAEGKGFDSQNTICWSPADGCYVCFFRSFKEVEGQRVRWISRTTSTDLVDWSAPEELDFGDAPAEHLYTNLIRPYYRAPHILVGTPARFLPGRWALTSEQEAAIGLHDDDKYDGLPGALSEAVLVSSRGGRRCDRTFLEALVRPGDDERDWVARSNYPALGIISTGERQMSMFVARHYGQPSAYLERLSLRVDGFASVTAGFEGGELITPTFVFPGDGLSLNISTAAVGSVRVEIQDETGMALQGLALDDGHELIGDDVDRLASWGPGSDLSHLRGRAVRLRLVLKEADVYALRFHQNRR
jgi:hypothetical protein